jgi:hypothetical protein
LHAGDFAQRLDAIGAPVGTPRLVTQAMYQTTSDPEQDTGTHVGPPSVASTPGGDFVVTWVRNAIHGGSVRVEGRRFSGN